MHLSRRARAVAAAALGAVPAGAAVLPPVTANAAPGTTAKHSTSTDASSAGIPTGKSGSTGRTTAPARPSRYCIVEATKPVPGVPTPVAVPRCYDSLDASYVAAGIDPADPTGRRRPVSTPSAPKMVGAAFPNQALAYHYKNLNGLGESLTVYGTDCGGGIVNFGAGWNDVFQSTKQGKCSQVKHFVNSEASGSSQITSGGTHAMTNLNSTLRYAESSAAYGGSEN